MNLSDPEWSLALLAILLASLFWVPWLWLQRRWGRTSGWQAREAEVAVLQQRLLAAEAALAEQVERLRQSEQQLADLRRRADELSDLRAAAEARAARIAPLEAQLSSREQELQAAHERLARQSAELAEVRTRGDEQQRAAADKLQLLEQAEQRLRESFHHLAQQILEERAKRFGEESQQQLGGLLEPLKLQLREFRESVITTHAAEQKERGALNQEIQNLKQLNLRISEDAINLTRALKGDSQVQGAWGELVLERLLEASGLQAGREFLLQTSFGDGDGGRARPDVIVRLPDEKDLVIDSKLSLVAWERYVAATEPAARELAIREHVVSLKRHMEELGRRNYSELPGLRTLDFVLMFVPVEAAFIEAVRRDEALYLHALERNIALVSPSTLLATLRTVAHLWKLERRNLNAMEIARRGALLHDHFATLVGELETIGQQLDKAQKAQASAMRRLTEGGKGSLLLQVQSLADLGAPARKAMPAGLLQQAGGEAIESTEE